MSLGFRVWLADGRSAPDRVVGMTVMVDMYQGRPWVLLETVRMASRNLRGGGNGER